MTQHTRIKRIADRYIISFAGLKRTIYAKSLRMACCTFVQDLVDAGWWAGAPADLLFIVMDPEGVVTECSTRYLVSAGPQEIEIKTSISI